MKTNDEIDRNMMSRSLAKAIAYANCGKQSDAQTWARTLIQELIDYGIITAEAAKKAVTDWEAK